MPAVKLKIICAGEGWKAYVPSKHYEPIDDVIFSQDFHYFILLWKTINFEKSLFYYTCLKNSEKVCFFGKKLRLSILRIIKKTPWKSISVSQRSHFILKSAKKPSKMGLV